MFFYQTSTAFVYYLRRVVIIKRLIGTQVILRELSAKEMAFDIACDFNEENIYVYVSSSAVTITDNLDKGYINVQGELKQLRFRNQLKLRSFIVYLREYKNVMLLNEDSIRLYQWV
ncbi:hypothetical protein AB3Z07_28570 (plasmid) [Metabacillus halosaccharovorans]|uniref:hypothetical protein n=1 Tax=Metabacillus halosaccharovorans TaxID=930124 RepID=UPI0034CDD19D